MIVRAELRSYGKEAKELTEEGLGLVQAIFPEAHKTDDYLYGVEGLVDLEALQEVLNKTNLEATVKPFKGNAFFIRKNGLEKRLKDLEEDFHLLKQETSAGGQVVQIHVPNFAMLSINQVDVLEDACTDALQEKLDEGWRILAVCPPLDERRPTYIIGRYVPDGAAAGKIAKSCG